MRANHDHDQLISCREHELVVALVGYLRSRPEAAKATGIAASSRWSISPRATGLGHDDGNGSERTVEGQWVDGGGTVSGR